MSHARAPDAPSEADKVAFLSDPSGWPGAPGAVAVEETHMAWVFLGPDRVLKLKKPVRTPVLDFRTLARRAAAVRDELRLNRRLAPEVYLGARALRVGPRGALTLGPAGRVVDWLVEMRRLPEDATLDARLRAGTATPADIAAVAGVLVPFYRALPPAGVTARIYLARLAREIATTARVLRDPALAPEGAETAVTALAEAFRAARPLLAARARAGRIVEGHGDLRPEHVFLTDPPVIIDCLEFNRALRTVDPFDEAVSLALDCARLGADWAGAELIDRLAEGLGERPPAPLLAFHWRYRALLRARLALLHLTEPVVRKPGTWRPMAARCLALAAEAEVRTRPRGGP